MPTGKQITYWSSTVLWVVVVVVVANGMLINANDVDKIGVVYSMLFVFAGLLTSSTGQDRTGQDFSCWKLPDETRLEILLNPALSCPVSNGMILSSCVPLHKYMTILFIAFWWYQANMDNNKVSIDIMKSGHACRTQLMQETVKEDVHVTSSSVWEVLLLQK